MRCIVNRRSVFRLGVLCLLVFGQAWGMSVLLLVRETEILMLCCIVASVFWMWWSWYSFLSRKKGVLVLTSVCLLLTLILLVLCAMDVGDVNTVLPFEGYRR